MGRQENEQKALDLVAGRGGDAPAPGKPAKKGLGTIELMGVLLWVLVLAVGGLGAAYFFLMAPK